MSNIPIEDVAGNDLDNDLMRKISDSFDRNVVWNITNELGHPYSNYYGAWSNDILKSKARLLQIVINGTYFASYPSSNILEQENAQLKIENYSLRNKIKAIEEKIANIEIAIPKEETVVLRDVTKDQALKEIKNLFLSGRTLYYSDIAEELGLSLRVVVDICNELKENGEISTGD